MNMQMDSYAAAVKKLNEIAAAYKQAYANIGQPFDSEKTKMLILPVGSSVWPIHGTDNVHVWPSDKVRLTRNHTLNQYGDRDFRSYDLPPKSLKKFTRWISAPGQFSQYGFTMFRSPIRMKGQPARVKVYGFIYDKKDVFIYDKEDVSTAPLPR